MFVLTRYAVPLCRSLPPPSGARQMKSDVRDAIGDVHKTMQQVVDKGVVVPATVILDCSFYRAELASSFLLNCCKDFAFEWLSLKTKIAAGEGAKNTVEEIVRLLQAQAKMLPMMLRQQEQFDSTLKSLLALQFMLQQIVCGHPIMDTNYILEQAIPVGSVRVAVHVVAVQTGAVARLGEA